MTLTGQDSRSQVDQPRSDRVGWTNAWNKGGHQSTNLAKKRDKWVETWAALEPRGRKEERDDKGPKGRGRSWERGDGRRGTTRSPTRRRSQSRGRKPTADIEDFDKGDPLPVEEARELMDWDSFTVAQNDKGDYLRS